MHRIALIAHSPLPLCNSERESPLGLEIKASGCAERTNRMPWYIVRNPLALALLAVRETARTGLRSPPAPQGSTHPGGASCGWRREALPPTAIWKRQRKEIKEKLQQIGLRTHR